MGSSVRFTMPGMSACALNRTLTMPGMSACALNRRHLAQQHGRGAQLGALLFSWRCRAHGMRGLQLYYMYVVVLI